MGNGMNSMSASAMVPGGRAAETHDVGFRRGTTHIVSRQSLATPYERRPARHTGIGGPDRIEAPYQAMETSPKRADLHGNGDFFFKYQSPPHCSSLR